MEKPFLLSKSKGGGDAENLTGQRTKKFSLAIDYLTKNGQLFSGRYDNLELTFLGWVIAAFRLIPGKTRTYSNLKEGKHSRFQMQSWLLDKLLF